MNQDLSIVTLLLHASGVVQAVVALLLVVSIASWAVIFSKSTVLSRVTKENTNFEHAFWSGTSMHDLYNTAIQKTTGSGPMERIFASGMREFLKLRERRIADTVVLLEGAQRAMRANFQREVDALESQLSFLGSVASVSPYVGLFGTVWGIMHAFTGLASWNR